MALSTVLKKIEKAKAAYEKQLAGISGELAAEVVAVLHKHIPDGWYLFWNQDDQMYNDEDYYFGIHGPWLVSVLEPRQGKLLKAEVPHVRETKKDSWGSSYEVITQYGSDAEYEWILDDQCKERTEEFDQYHSPGVIHLDSYDSEYACGLSEELSEAVYELFSEIDVSTMRQAFGDSSEVRVNRDGTYEVK